tara:strand:- start:2500 stop:3405 length:906 start_codon:yes stop_codon:yes gene_type:complete
MNIKIIEIISIVLIIIFLKFIQIFMLPSNITQSFPKIKEIYEVKSKFQTIRIVDENNLGRVLLCDNEVQLSQKDDSNYHELLVHFPSLYVKDLNLENVLIIGGGDLMTLREVMKYSTIKNVVILEIDPVLVEACIKYFNMDDYKNDERVKIIYGDAYNTIDDIKLNFDLCIIDTTEDNEANLSIDKKDFFLKCQSKLKKDGICVKNGAEWGNIMDEVFGSSITYGIYIKTFDDIYRFCISSNDDEKILYKRIPRISWMLKGIKTYVYDIKKHTDYVIWDYSSFLKTKIKEKQFDTNYLLMK